MHLPGRLNPADPTRQVDGASFGPVTPGLRLRQLWWQGLHEGNGDLKPVPQCSLVTRVWIDEDVTLDRPPRHLHGLCAYPRQRMRVLAFADTDEEATSRRSGNHVAVQHEAQPAEHPHFRHRAGPSENGA